MNTLVINASEIRRLLPMRTCMDLMADALRTLGRDEAVNPLRGLMRLPGKVGILGMMPGYMSAPATLGTATARVAQA